MLHTSFILFIIAIITVIVKRVRTIVLNFMVRVEFATCILEVKRLIQLLRDYSQTQ